MMQEVFHINQFEALKSFVNKTPPNEIFLVRGKGSYASSGAEKFINELVNNEILQSFSDFDPNPQLEDLQRGIQLFNTGNFKQIIAIGGGSVLDMAKLISVFAHQESSVESLVKGENKIKDTKTPLLAIPTTAGSGAEATQFAVLYINKTKYSVAHASILPDSVYLSSEFSLSARHYLTACTGLDAFSQAIESLWSVNATTESESFALEAINLIWHNLHTAVNKNSAEAKEKMQWAAYQAGRAINITKTTAPHALSYAFTSYYNVPHGHAVALSLPFFIKFNYETSAADCTDSRGPQAVRERISKIHKAINVNENSVVSTLVDFFSSLGISIRINDLTQNFDKNIILDNVNFERLSNNPRKVTSNDIENYLATYMY